MQYRKAALRTYLSILTILLVSSFQLVWAQTSIDLRGDVDGSGIPGGSIMLGMDTEACIPAKAGSIRYNSSTNCAEYCNGADWTCPGCSSPNDPIWVTASGTIDTVNENIGVYAQLEATDEVGTPNFQKTSGASWINVSSSGIVSGKATGGTGSFPITVRATDCEGNSVDRSFDVVVNAWGGPAGCTNPGEVCSDGTVYAGLTPDGDVDFFVHANVLPTNFPWKDDGSTSGYVNTPVQDCTGVDASCVTGEANTNALVLVDSQTDDGFQLHRAALACFCLGEEHPDAPDGTVPAQCSGDPVGTNALEGHGYDDWYLPAIAELDVLYVNLVAPTDPDNPHWPSPMPAFFNGVAAGESPPIRDGALAGTFSSWYWSSSEAQSSIAWRLSMSNGEINSSGNNQSGATKNLSRAVHCARKG